MSWSNQVEGATLNIMTYNQFNNKVRGGLLYRANPPDPFTETFIEQCIRDWMAEMQYYVENFRIANETTYKESDFTISCEGGAVDLPEDMDKLIEVTFIRPVDRQDKQECACTVPLDPLNWKYRYDIFNSKKTWVFAVDPRGKEMVVNPTPEDDEGGDADKDEKIIIRWDGVKMDYDGADKVPFGPDTVKCCSNYVNAELSRLKEDKRTRYESFYQSYMDKRLQIYNRESGKV